VFEPIANHTIHVTVGGPQGFHAMLLFGATSGRRRSDVVAARRGWVRKRSKHIVKLSLLGFVWCVGGASFSSLVLADSISYADSVIGMGPVSYWRLGEVSGGTALDLAGTSNGTYSGVELGRAGSVAGDSNTSAYFTGSAYVEVPHSANYMLDNGTIMFSFQDNNSIHDAGLFSKDSLNKDSGGHVNIHTTVDGRVAARMQSTSDSIEIVSQPFITLDTWNYVAFTFGDQGMRLYINGVLASSDPFAIGLGTTSGGAGNTEPIVLGASQIISDPDGQIFPLRGFFSGLIDDVIIFDRALSGTEVEQLSTLKFIPEPASGMLLMAGALLLTRRRRAGRPSL